ncbi:MAG: iron ABC transporter permease [Eubacteriales bacterium]|nr:iron ABC transporter permease [Eubacteriales bacterium]
MKNKRLILVFIGSTVVLLTAIVLSIAFGSISVAFGKVLQALFNPDVLTDTQYQIIRNIRLPRVILAVFVGAALSASGALLQSVMQNPLADPGIIGVSSGASLAIMVILLLVPAYAPILPLIAFLGGIAATVLIYILSWKNGINTLGLLLAGIAVNAMLGGASGLISVLNSEKIQTVILWINGTLAGRSWHDIAIVVPYTTIGLIAAIFCIRGANMLLLGDDKAANLGLNTHHARILLSLVAAFLAGVSTAAVGVIGFIGLVVPHISRLLVGSDYKVLLPFCIINGGSFLLITDTLSRVIASPLELPVGTIMAIIGGPFFLYLLRKRRAR